MIVNRLAFQRNLAFTLGNTFEGLTLASVPIGVDKIAGELAGELFVNMDSAELSFVASMTTARMMSREVQGAVEAALVLTLGSST